ncbi:uncharacterized protein NECHADRAFT_49898 [Fusarium vanettenii 77-13-4]|uniref:Transcription factor domain-containing protein n=1 Tax=Fusarium vanettenii (strain ATCC MYA-4622 / CBS 123669 / FGSC 9596 / NRRL 45880 / 77-13-4) TaxID=660122 RepID=C7ZNM5_FUSV7|nr:uncharacterized protein NECHADRAFT_49898 [Fusarium vanettenii 77-13-4]EEU34204.1 hypothetical protein NECHADRAFT_49898 [Fusarium vanettenii 77-13-4]
MSSPIRQPSTQRDPDLGSSTHVHQTNTALDEEVVRTVVSSSNDARNVLFKVANEYDTDDPDDQPGYANVLDDVSLASPLTNNTKVSHQAPQVVVLSNLTKADAELWSRQRFVRQGWFTAQEAITYIDLFFQNLSFLSPILDTFFADHKNHKHLIIEEPLLCCTLLMISSRYHILPGYDGPSRADFIHMRLWKYCEHLINRITFGAEKYCTARTRTLCSIQALLLITEWHPRAVRFPPESDGWDHGLAPGVDDSYGHPHGVINPNAIRWREEVFEPAKRSDRMSWSLVGLATTLAHELGVFQDTGDEIGDSTTGSQPSRALIQRLLFLYIHQLTLRLGCTSIFPQTLQLATYLPPAASTPERRFYYDREVMLSQYIGITKLLKTATDTFFPSKRMARQVIRSGRYLTLLGHFTPLLDSWYKEFTDLELPTISDASKQLLLLEYYYATMYINSVGIQAFVERASHRDSQHMFMHASGIHLSDYPQDLTFNDAVREASCNILAIAIKLGESGCLRYCPVRPLLRLVVASVFLLKSLSLGVRNRDMFRSLDILDKFIMALKENRHDDVHLSVRYATLIARLIRRFKRNLRTQTSLSVSKVVSPEPRAARSCRQSLGLNGGQNGVADIITGDMSLGQGDAGNFSNDAHLNMDEWFAQPFDPSLAPFGLELDAGMSDPVPESLDFLWNIPYQ